MNTYRSFLCVCLGGGGAEGVGPFHFPFLDGDVPRSASYGVYISQLIRFARVSSHVDDFNTRNKF